jgi:O-methyltransferase involved in polyketide biosynthesis
MDPATKKSLLGAALDNIERISVLYVNAEMDNGIFRSQQRRISKTAGNMALIRALEFLRLPNQRLFSDPYARQFVPICQRALLGPAHLPAIRALLERFFDWRAPGARSSGAARTRLIDDWVGEALAAPWSRSSSWGRALIVARSG